SIIAFFDPLDLGLSKPQHHHLLNIADALLVCEGTKTLAALQRQFLQAPDASNMAGFLRISPWDAEKVRGALRANQVTWVTNQAERNGAPKIMYINLDDSLGEKDKHTGPYSPLPTPHSLLSTPHSLLSPPPRNPT
ncbi:MAG: hypothetical protein ACE5GO_05575, partial [Anaerolineales bacterium]